VQGPRTLRRSVTWHPGGVPGSDYSVGEAAVSRGFTGLSDGGAKGGLRHTARGPQTLAVPPPASAQLDRAPPGAQAPTQTAPPALDTCHLVPAVPTPAVLVPAVPMKAVPMPAVSLSPPLTPGGTQGKGPSRARLVARTLFGSSLPSLPRRSPVHRGSPGHLGSPSTLRVTHSQRVASAPGDHGTPGLAGAPRGAGTGRGHRATWGPQCSRAPLSTLPSPPTPPLSHTLQRPSSPSHSPLPSHSPPLSHTIQHPSSPSHSSLPSHPSSAPPPPPWEPASQQLPSSSPAKGPLVSPRSAAPGSPGTSPQAPTQRGVPWVGPLTPGLRAGLRAVPQWR